MICKTPPHWVIYLWCGILWCFIFLVSQKSNFCSVVSWHYEDMTLRIIYSGVFIRRFFQVCFWISVRWILYILWAISISHLTLSMSPHPQDSPSFSFLNCLPRGWTMLLFSGITTLLSEKIFLDRKNFWPTFAIHFSVGFACFCVSSLVMYLSFAIFFYINTVG